MVEIVMRLGWSYISIIYEESNYGVKAYEELEELLSHHNICIAVKEKLVKDSGVAQERAYDTIVQKLLTKSRARGEQKYLMVKIRRPCGSLKQKIQSIRSFGSYLIKSLEKRREAWLRLFVQKRSPRNDGLRSSYFTSFPYSLPKVNCSLYVH
jgi:Receptor family ligand binding region